MTESAGQLEHVDGSRRPQLDGGVVEGPIQVGQITGDIVAAKQRAGQKAAAFENLVGEFAAQHQVIRDAFAGFVLGQAVERFDAGRGEREQVAIRSAVHGERVAVTGASRRDRGDGIGDRDIPRQTGALGVRRIGNQRVRHGLND